MPIHAARCAAHRQRGSVVAVFFTRYSIPTLSPAPRVAPRKGADPTNEVQVTAARTAGSEPVRRA
jgi:hypothetical protein